MVLADVTSYLVDTRNHSRTIFLLENMLLVLLFLYSLLETNLKILMVLLHKLTRYLTCLLLIQFFDSHMEPNSVLSVSWVSLLLIFNCLVIIFGNPAWDYMGNHFDLIRKLQAWE